MNPHLSVILPMYDEEAMVPKAIAAVREVVEPIGHTFEIVCVDDGSRDRTGVLLDEEAARDPRVVPVHFSRNFGKEAAMAAGLETARGDAVLILDADLQHPPDLIPRMVERWEAGFDVVDAVKEDRGEEGLWYGLASRAFYVLMGSSVGRRLEGSSDFKLLDRQVVEAVLACPERNRFFRGLVAWVGFRVARIPFSVRPRAAGSTRWGKADLVAYSIGNLVAFTSMPLKLVSLLGFAIVLLDVLLAVDTLWNWALGVAVDGFTTVLIADGLIGGTILLSLGVVALYVAQIYEEQKARPIFVVRRAREAGRPAGDGDERPSGRTTDGARAVGGDPEGGGA